MPGLSTQLALAAVANGNQVGTAIMDFILAFVRLKLGRFKKQPLPDRHHPTKQIPGQFMLAVWLGHRFNTAQVSRDGEGIIGC